MGYERVIENGMCQSMASVGKPDAEKSLRLRVKVASWWVTTDGQRIGAGWKWKKHEARKTDRWRDDAG